MSKPNPFAVLKDMPARATAPVEPEQSSEAYEQPTAPPAAEPTVPRANPIAIVTPATVAAPMPPSGTSPFPSKQNSIKSIREKRTTRIDPNVYDAVERELSRQKRARKRASSTLSDLLDELLRAWLRANGVQPE